MILTLIEFHTYRIASNIRFSLFHPKWFIEFLCNTISFAEWKLWPIFRCVCVDLVWLYVCVNVGECLLQRKMNRQPVRRVCHRYNSGSHTCIHMHANNNFIACTHTYSRNTHVFYRKIVHSKPTFQTNSLFFYCFSYFFLRPLLLFPVLQWKKNEMKWIWGRQIGKSFFFLDSFYFRMICRTMWTLVRLLLLLLISFFLFSFFFFRENKLIPTGKTFVVFPYFSWLPKIEIQTIRKYNGKEEISRIEFFVWDYLLGAALKLINVRTIPYITKPMKI